MKRNNIFAENSRGMAIEVHGLVKRFGTQVAVNNISFSVNQQEIVGFLGPNGAGKSTTMKIITGYLQANEGKVLVNGLDVQKNTLEVKRSIGYLPESNALYHDMYVKEYLKFVGKIYQVNQLPARIAEIIEWIGLGVEQHKQIGQLSKGYKQRVGLAAALLHNPPILVLDEPTSGLDPNQIIEIRNIIQQQGQTKAVLFSSHILQEVEAICHKVVIIAKGEVKANDTLANLQALSNKKIVRVVFEESIEAEWLQRLPSTVAVNKKPQGVWEITTQNMAATKKEIMHLAVEQEFHIAELQAGNHALENIFASITK